MKYKLLSLSILAGLFLSNCASHSHPGPPPPGVPGYVPPYAPCSNEEAIYFIKAGDRLLDDINKRRLVTEEERYAALRMSCMFLLLGIMETDTMSTSEKYEKIASLRKSARKLAELCKGKPASFLAAGEKLLTARYRNECHRASVRAKHITKCCMNRHPSKRLANVISECCDAIQLE